jgi:hypothetical protein
MTSSATAFLQTNGDDRVRSIGIVSVNRVNNTIQPARHQNAHSTGV